MNEELQAIAKKFVAGEIKFTESLKIEIARLLPFQLYSVESFQVDGSGNYVFCIGYSDRERKCPVAVWDSNTEPRQAGWKNLYDGRDSFNCAGERKQSINLGALDPQQRLDVARGVGGAEKDARIAGNVVAKAWHLAGEIDGRPVYWMERDPECGYQAEHSAPAERGVSCGHPACKSLGEPHPFCEFVQKLDAAPAEQPPAAVGVPEGYVLARETVVDMPDGSKELGYTLISRVGVFRSAEDVFDAIKELSLPLGWVSMTTEQLLPPMFAAAPAPVQQAERNQPLHDFKNFHRLLCERFGYTHDERDWQRDQISLIEHITALKAQPAEQQPAQDVTRLVEALGLIKRGAVSQIKRSERPDLPTVGRWADAAAAALAAAGVKSWAQH